MVSADIPRNKNKAFFVAILTVALLVGAFECLFGRVAYSADAINYLNIVRAIHAGDWKLTLRANEKDSVRDVLGNAVHGRLFYNGDQWRAGLGMEQMGLAPGSKVAVMSDLVGASHSTWAYMDRLQIVGILGGSLDAAQTAEYDAFWNSTPERQRQILGIFRDSGAQAAVSISEPRGDGAPGWARVAGTEFFCTSILEIWAWSIADPRSLDERIGYLATNELSFR